MVGEAEYPGAEMRIVRTHAFEHGRAVVQGMRADIHRAIGKVPQPAIEPGLVLSTHVGFLRDASRQASIRPLTNQFKENQSGRQVRAVGHGLATGWPRVAPGFNFRAGRVVLKKCAMR